MYLHVVWKSVPGEGARLKISIVAFGKLTAVVASYAMH